MERQLGTRKTRLFADLREQTEPRGSISIIYPRWRNNSIFLTMNILRGIIRSEKLYVMITIRCCPSRVTLEFFSE